MRSLRVVQKVRSKFSNGALGAIVLLLLPSYPTLGHHFRSPAILGNVSYVLWTVWT